MIKEAMILAAGFGRRLNPLTYNTPKPLLKIGNYTLLSNTLNFLEKIKVNKVVINTHYLQEKIVEYLDKKKFDLDITIVNEKKKILDTGGGILNALEHFNDNFICINPDTIWNSNYIEEFKQMEKNFQNNKKKCHLLVVDRQKSFDKNLKGDFNLEDDLISRSTNSNLKYIFTGLQIINPKIFSNIDDKVFSINQVWDKLIKKNELFALESKVHFLHVSTLEIYKKLNIK